MSQLEDFINWTIQWEAQIPQWAALSIELSNEEDIPREPIRGL